MKMATDNLALALATAARLYQQAQVQAQQAQKDAEETKIKQMMLQKALQPDPMLELDKLEKIAKIKMGAEELELKKTKSAREEKESEAALLGSIGEGLSPEETRTRVSKFLPSYKVESKGGIFGWGANEQIIEKTQDDQAYDWALANPGNPKVAQILTKLKERNYKPYIK